MRQTDQAYTRRVLDDKLLDADETRGFNRLVDEVLQEAIQHLEASPKRKGDKDSDHRGKP